MNPMLVTTLFVIVVLQLAVIAMLQHVYANKNVKRLGELLEAQNERIAKELHEAIAQGTTAAHDAYKEANQVNLKISDLNERLLANEAKEKERP